VSFGSLAIIAVIGLLGPLLALPARWHLPVVLGELLGGITLGATGLRYLHAQDPTFTFVADIGFALIMFVAGSRVPFRRPGQVRSLREGTLRSLGVGCVAVPVAVALSRLVGTGHTPLYAVLLTSSSAALALPIIDSLGLGGAAVQALLPQIAVADAACIVALPLAIDPPHAGRAAVGAVTVIAAAVLVFLALRQVEARGVRRRVHRVSERRRFAVELRVSLATLFALAALAVHTHVSIMLAGFTLGLAVAAVGEPRRLAKQLFAITEGFLGPVFFVWLGASLDLRELGGHPRFILLGVALGLGAVVAHLAMRLTGQPVAAGLLAAAQLGVPVAAATIGSQLGVLRPGESAALILGGLVTVAAAVVGGGLATRSPAFGESASATHTGPVPGPPGPPGAAGSAG
jgi:Kef-type K+ transport system membrane component KefB